MKKRISTFMVMLGFLGYGFNLQVTTTSETCSGNGALTFITTNRAPNSSIVFFVYKLPNVTTPLTTLSANSLQGLVAGDYRVVAKETVGTTVSTKQVDVSIANEKTSLVYTVQALNQACSENSNLVINVESGVASSYEIIDGPVTFPSQTNNTFFNLPQGVYKIRVFDQCGVGNVTTYTITLNPIGLNVSNTSETVLNCNQKEIFSTITPNSGTIIGYPLTVEYTLFLPDGTEQTINQNYVSGDLESLTISATFPLFVNEVYDYEINIQDSCNNDYQYTGSVVSDLQAVINTVRIPCDGYYFFVNVTSFTAPLTLTMISGPTGFDPSNFNTNYPGPYENGQIQFGNMSATVPYGFYSFMVTDACGKTKTVSKELINNPPEVDLSAVNNDCENLKGIIYGNIPGYGLSKAVIISAPENFPNTLPYDVSSFINNITGALTLTPIAAGDYTFELTNLCTGEVETGEVTVPLYIDKGFNSEIRNGCGLGKSAIKINSDNGPIVQATLIDGPSLIGNSSNLNAYLVDGILYLSDLISGDYVFEVQDSCDFSETITLSVEGYMIENSSFEMITNCGSFDIALNFVSNGTTNESYWLQKLIDSDNQIWGHPITNSTYLENSIPNNVNSIRLNNLSTNYNFSFNGTFRIVRSFETFYNGLEFNTGSLETINKKCLEYLEPHFEFSQSLEITNISSAQCSSDVNPDVIVQTQGIEPLHYTIVTKDGLPFLVDNGNQNIFLNLNEGTYTLEVEDSCGNIVSRVFETNSLPKIVTLNTPPDIVTCKTIITGNEVFNISNLSDYILGDQSQTDYTLNYYTSETDALSGLNPISNLANYNPSENPFTIYVGAYFNSYPNCKETTSFQLIVGKNPVITINSQYISCENEPITIDASSGNSDSTSFSWSNGANTPSVTVSETGIYTLTVEAQNTYGNPNQTCVNSKETEIVISQKPKIKEVLTSDWTSNENSIKVATEKEGNYEYSIDNNQYQSDSFFGGLSTGIYTVWVRDIYGCGVDSEEVTLLNYPPFFTPNGDGINEFWRIPFMEREDDLKVIIYDRYGKLVHSFFSESFGWDGTYNGSQLPSSDYWFVVYRMDGRILRGHFTLKR